MPHLLWAQKSMLGSRFMDRTETENSTVSLRTFITVFIVAALVEIFFLGQPRQSGVLPVVYLGIARFSQGLLIIATVFLMNRRLSTVGLSCDTLISGIKKGLLWSGGFGCIVLIASWGLLFMGIDPLGYIGTPVPESTNRLFLFFLVGGIISPITEEIFFRGVLYGFLRRWGAAPAVLLSSLAFVLAHMPGKGSLVVPAVGGIIFAISYEMEKNLMVPITIHILGNQAIFFLSLLNG